MALEQVDRNSFLHVPAHVPITVRVRHLKSQTGKHQEVSMRSFIFQETHKPLAKQGVWRDFSRPVPAEGKGLRSITLDESL